ncbi:MAG: tetratricopeptide repeat protein [Hydrococcus sp. SU_1_0]|nr:tetratricopeptide repeat protein [Hydrococcus sp. SU_1_0]
MAIEWESIRLSRCSEGFKPCSVEQNPDRLDAYYARSEIYYSVEDYDAGIKDLNAILQLNSQDALAYMYRGYGYGQLNNYSLAIDDYNQVLSLSPNYSKAYF